MIDPDKCQSTSSTVDHVMGFFDTFNYMAKASIEHSFYILNGSLVMYVALLFSIAARGAITHLNVESMRKRVFTIFFGAITLTFAVIVVVWMLGQD